MEDSKRNKNREIGEIKMIVLKKDGEWKIRNENRLKPSGSEEDERKRRKNE